VKSLIPHYEATIISNVLSEAFRKVEIKGEGNTHLLQQLLQNHKERHQIPRIRRKHPLIIRTPRTLAHMLRRRTHRRRHDFARRVHEQFGKPFEDFLDLLRVGLLEVCHGEIDSDVADAACDFCVGLEGRDTLVDGIEEGMQV